MYAWFVRDMAVMTRRVVLLLPGLAGPASDHPVADYFDRRPAILDRLISRSELTSAAGSGADATLLRQFGLNETAAVAPLTCLADTGRRPASYVMRADPVHLRADQSCLRLFDTNSISIERDEADALVAAFNTFYADRGWRLEAPVANRWYLFPGEAPEITTWSPEIVAGKDINPFLPEGPDARGWHAMLNEVQMLFHAHDVNLERERRGQPPINSLWLWGGGELRTDIDSTYKQVYADDSLALALAGLAGVACAGLPVAQDDWIGRLDDGNTLLCVDRLRWPARYNDIEQWLDELFALESSMFSYLADAVNSRRIETLSILPCNGQVFTVTRRGLRRFWRRVQAYEQVLA